MAATKKTKSKKGLPKKSEAKREKGRPSVYTDELANKICLYVSKGYSLRKICEMDDMPSGVTVWDWLFKRPDFLKQYEVAKEQSAEADQEKLEDIGEEAIIEAKKVGEKRAGAVVAAYKLKADVIKWSMSKKKPKKYGDKVDVTSGGDKLPAQPITGVKVIIEKE